MKTTPRLLLVAAAAVLAAGLAIGAAAEVGGRTVPLESPAQLGTTIAADPEVKREGKASIRVQTRWPTTVCLAEIDDIETDDTTLVFRAQLKAQELEGQAYLEMWVHLEEGAYYSRGVLAAVRDTTDWQSAETPFQLKPGQVARKVTLNLVVKGKGTVWVDDAVLVDTAAPSSLELPAQPPAEAEAGDEDA
jgi:hypothetical protein